MFWTYFPAPTCQKQQWKDYYEENGCRSKKKIKRAQCVGSCGVNCCQPRKTKKRKVRAICNDGTSFMKDVEVIRKCTCVKQCENQLTKDWNNDKNKIQRNNKNKMVTFKCQSREEVTLHKHTYILYSLFFFMILHWKRTEADSVY